MRHFATKEVTGNREEPGRQIVICGERIISLEWVRAAHTRAAAKCLYR